MPSNPLPPRFRDRHLVPDDYEKLSLEVIDEPRNPPVAGIFDLPIRCYVVNEEWDKHISGAVSVLSEWRAWNGDEDDRDTSVQAILAFLGQEGDCSVAQLQVRQNDSDPCILEYSVNGGMDWVEFADILDCVTEQFLESSILNAILTDTAIQDAIDDLTDGGTDNELPPVPTSAEPDELCDSAYYMTDKIIEFIDQTLTDASTITLEEFLTALLGLGGFDASLLKLFWDFIVANSYPDLLDDVEDARHIVAEILYCNELDQALVISEIDDSSIGDEAQAAYIGAINAITDGKWALWAFVGSQIDSGEDCSAFCDWQETWLNGDGQGDWVAEPAQDNTYAVYNGGDDRWDGTFNEDTTNRIIINIDFDETTITRVQFTVEIENYNDGNPRPQQIFLDDNQQLITGNLADGTHDVEWTGSIDATSITLYARADEDVESGGYCRITQITVEGEGENPFV